MLESILTQLVEGRPLSANQMQSAIEAVLDGQCTEAEIAALLTALRIRGETVEEVVGAARALRAHVTPIRTQRSGLLDTCGTGGDGARTFNISTATAIVVAAAGVPVAKHGNRSISSASGSADVLRALGVHIEASVAVVERTLDELGIGFCYAPQLHGAMRHVAPVRQQLRFATLFNLLGPLTNPAGAEYQLLGANRSDTARKLAAALGQLGCRRALVVCGQGLDEVSLAGPTLVWTVEDGKLLSEEPAEWVPEDFGLSRCGVEELQVDSAMESAGVIREVLADRPGPARDIVLANAAAAFLVVGRANSLPKGVTLAAGTLASGAANELLRKLVEHTQSTAG